MSKIEKHFDGLAKDYDYFKEKNHYYYDNIKELVLQIVGSGKNKSVLDIGCGTGDLLHYLSPLNGVGVDLSGEMVAIAQKKYPEYTFFRFSAEEVSLKEKFDFIILVDIIEHLRDVTAAIKNLSEHCGKGTQIIISMANPLWEPVLMFLENVGMKMPEGQHYRIPFRKLKKILSHNGLVVQERGWRLICPAKLFPFYFLNAFFYNIPVIKRLGVIEYIVLCKSEKAS